MRRLVAAVALVLAVTAPLAASQFAQLSLDQLTMRAAVVAQVVAVSRAVEDVDGVTTTVVTCRVERSWRGESDGSLVLRVPGGQVGELTARVPGAPIPEVGDRFVLFGEPDGTTVAGAAVVRPVGLGQGMFELVERAGETFAVQVLDRAPEKFAACEGETESCAARFAGRAFRLAELVARVTAPGGSR